jgi:iron(III) transport system substrate-binding protein
MVPAVSGRNGLVARARLAAGVLIFAGAMVGSSQTIAQSAALPSQIQALIPQAKAEGSVTLQLGTAFSQAETAAFSEAFAKKFGIEIRIELLDSGGSAAALARKYAAAYKSGIKPPVDVLPQSEAALAVFREAGIVNSVNWKALGIPEDKISQFGDAVLTYVFPTTTIFYNTDLVKGDDVPKTHKDLLDPKWKGKLVAVPRGIAHLGLSLIMGEEAALDFIRKMVDTQDVIWAPNPVDALQKVGSGEAYLGFGTAPWLKGFPGVPVKIATLDKVAGAPYKSVVLNSQSGHTAASALMVYFLCCTVEGKQAYYALTGYADFNTPGTIPGEIGADGRGIVYPNEFDVNTAPKLAVEFDKALGVR